MTTVRREATRIRGNPIDVIGAELQVGQRAPDFTLVAQDLSDVHLADTSGTVRIISVVSSLDTGVCAAETRRWEAESASLDGAEIITVSMDLPFAQKRWCGAANIDKVIMASDHRDASFGKNYGVLISGGPLDRVLARAVFVIGPDDKVKHAEYVGSIGEQPNYDAALAAAK